MSPTILSSFWDPLGQPLLLGPPHTRAKSRDHEIVRAHKKVSLVVLTLLQNHVVW